MKIIKSLPSDVKSEMMFIDIELGDVCNYQCSYCLPISYSGNEWLDYNTLISFFERVVVPNNTFVNLSGGEPSLYPRITSLLKYLNKKGCYINFVSNASRSLKWWKKHIKYIGKPILSYHLEFQKIDSFINKLKELTKTNLVQVNIPMIHDRFDECLEISERIKEIDNLLISLKVLKNKRENKLFKYTDEQFKIMSKKVFTKRTVSEPPLYNMPILIFEDGSKQNLNHQKLINNKQNNFKGWKCWKGMNSIKIHSNGDYYLASCELGNKKKYGNINDNIIKLPTAPSICDMDYCFCVSDIWNIRKER
jgi:organic radical activating enzyme